MTDNQVIGAKKKRGAPARRRAWRRVATDDGAPVSPGQVAVKLSNDVIIVLMVGPEDEVERIADRLLRDLPEGR